MLFYQPFPEKRFITSHCIKIILSYLQAAFYEIMCGLWVRNGLQIRGQAMTYIQNHFCKSMVDADLFLLQVCSTQLPQVINYSKILGTPSKNIIAQFYGNSIYYNGLHCNVIYSYITGYCTEDNFRAFSNPPLALPIFSSFCEPPYLSRSRAGTEND